MLAIKVETFLEGNREPLVIKNEIKKEKVKSREIT